MTITEDESISSLPLITHNSVEMLHDTPLYKSIVDDDIHIDSDSLVLRDGSASVTI